MGDHHYGDYANISSCALFWIHAQRIDNKSNMLSLSFKRGHFCIITKVRVAYVYSNVFWSCCVFAVLCVVSTSGLLVVCLLERLWTNLQELVKRGRPWDEWNHCCILGWSVHLCVMSTADIRMVTHQVFPFCLTLITVVSFGGVALYEYL